MRGPLHEVPRDLPSSVLVVGSGGREHALVRALAASPARPRLLCAPGNPGIAEAAACFPVAADDVVGLVSLARRERVAFVVVGPEVPLALGLVDALAEAGIPAYGPKADGARLEASKIITKELLIKYRIPTAPAALFSEAGEACAWLRSQPMPIVVKADGLAAGKGVVVAQTLLEAQEAVRALLGLRTAGPGADGPGRILIEECLTGEETSVLVVVSGRDYAILPIAQDHKRVGENDTGPNTGGMGACSPASVVTEELLARIERDIVRPSVNAIADEGMDFRGTLFIGLMLTADGPKVLEYNTRFGDPETQAILPRLDTDILELLWAASRGTLAGVELKVGARQALCVVIAAAGYPGSYPKGDRIQLPSDGELPPETWILQAGTAKNPGGELVTQGGRVLNVVSLGPTLVEAAGRAYLACERVQCSSKYYRRDIGARQIARA